MNPWFAFAKKYASENNISYQQALQLAGPSYRSSKQVSQVQVSPVRKVIQVQYEVPKLPKQEPKKVIKRIKVQVKNLEKAIKVQTPPTRYVYVKYYSVLTVNVEESLRTEYFKRIYGENAPVYDENFRGVLTPSDEMIHFAYNNLYHDENRLGSKWRVLYIGRTNTGLQPWDIMDPNTWRPYYALSGPATLNLVPKILDVIKIEGNQNIVRTCKLYLEEIYEHSKYRECVMWWNYEVMENPRVVTELENMPINKRILNYDRFGKKAFETAFMKRDSKCGIEAIYDRFYDNRKKYGLIKWFNDDGSMIKNFIKQAYEAQRDAILISKDFEIVISDLPEWDGRITTAAILKKLCKAMNVSCYIASEDSDIICSHKSTRINQNDICLCGYIADGHFYRVEDFSKVRSFVERSLKKDIPKNLPMPGVYKQETSRTFNWQNAKLIKEDASFKNRQILEFLDTAHTEPTCLVINIDSLERFHDYML